MRASPAARCSWVRTRRCIAISGTFTGENALLHAPHDTDDFARVVREALAEPGHLAQLADAGQRMVHERYTHPAIARTLYEQLCRVHAGRGT